jgi:hypothetical protein
MYDLLVRKNQFNRSYLAYILLLSVSQRANWNTPGLEEDQNSAERNRTKPAKNMPHRELMAFSAPVSGEIFPNGKF